MGLVITGKAAQALQRSIPDEMTEDTHPMLEQSAKHELSGKNNAVAPYVSPALVIYVQERGNWTQTQYAKEDSRLRIGSDASVCNIVLPEADAEKVHVTLRQLEGRWHVMESAHERKMLVNGMKRPQVVLNKGVSCLLKIGSRSMILSNPKECGASDRTGLELPPDKSFMLNLENGEHKLPIEESVLIGSSPDCKVRTASGTPEFLGIMFNFSKRLYVCSVEGGENALSVDGAPAEHPKHLKHRSLVSLGKKELCTVEYPDEIRETIGFTLMPSFSGHLAIMEISGGAAGQKLILPNAGRSISIGRSPENHFIIESPKMSRKHAQLVIYDNCVMALDNASTNGTFIENERIAKKMLHPGETIQFGDKKYLLCHSE